jgi:hypothetical protein
MRKIVLAATALLAIATLSGTVPNSSAPASAQPNGACLRNNQIWSTSVIDDRTIIANDRFNNPFVVELSGGCSGLTSNLGQVDFRTRTNLGCLSRGDRVSFRHRTLGRNTCFVRDVHTDLTTLARSGRPPVRTARVTR